MKRLIAGLAFACAIAILQVPGFANDKQIANQIAARLQQQKSVANLSDFNIGVQVDKGTVTMMGQVADSNQAMTALDIARRVPGVKLVVNDLYIKNDSAQAQIRQVSASIPAQPQVAGTQVGFTGEPAVGAGVAARPMPQQPIAYAPSQSIRTAQMQPRQIAPAQYNSPVVGAPAMTPVAMQGGVAQAGYDQPSMPGYAWPSYSAYPNYGSLTYPHQYSPTAWPYIGPFYPYPQVPLGWRKVSLEWDDGWWWLDFQSK
ncbi:MAG: BON domain-containing protein [Planctomycetales bacterium]|nr:BON domain-containing protein [Planctomycetales bacterium]